MEAAFLFLRQPAQDEPLDFGKPDIAAQLRNPAAAFAKCGPLQCHWCSHFQSLPMQERRTERRFPLLRRATLLVGTSSAINCTVRDISAAGAGLTASGAADLSGEVKLTLDGGRTYRPARVAWGLLDRAGIKFDARP